MQHNRLFVFDIETIPDTDCVPRLVDDAPGDVIGRRTALEAYHLGITDGRNSFPRQPFHKVVAISFLEAEIFRQGTEEAYTLTEIRTGGDVSSNEKDLLQGFFAYIERKKPRIVSFNGRTFDLPVLKYRAMVHGVSAPWFNRAGDKWNSYYSRYSLDWHCDLLDALSDFGASARLRLNEACAAFGFPGKTGIDGSKVATLYDEGALASIRNYCETDVINTYLVYLKYQHFQGTLSTDAYTQAITDCRAYLTAERTERPHLGEFLDAWDALAA